MKKVTKKPFVFPIMEQPADASRRAVCPMFTLCVSFPIWCSLPIVAFHVYMQPIRK
ncbi:hypothetical protein [Bacteroides xylanisolvens]|uniref:hypothetical protein n=1 Tax=Bacteroides xylanisolvens TaxID=371601 RepID=UPI003519413D